MIGIIALLSMLSKAARHAWHRPEFRALLALVAVLVLTGMIVYHRVEDFAWVDAFYFTVISLTTVGYGDLAPATAAGKVFTALYVLVGVGVLVAFVTEIAASLLAVRRGPAERNAQEQGGGPDRL